MGKPAQKRWTHEEDEFLLKNYHRMTDREIAERFGRTMQAVDCRRSRLGIGRSSRDGVGGAWTVGYSKSELEWARENATTGPDCEARMMLVFAADRLRMLRAMQ